jgi:hypothetical protein
MVDLYLLALLDIIITEYGFQTRKSALGRFTARWRWRRTLLRVLIWCLVFTIWFFQTRRLAILMALFVIALISSEMAAFTIRRFVQREGKSPNKLGKPWPHLLPFLFALIPAGSAALVLNGIIPIASVDPPDFPIQMLMVLVGIVAMFCWATMVTVGVIGMVRAGGIPDQIEPHLGAGEVIGILERLLTLALVLAGGLTAVGFAITAKAAARYPQFKDPAFAEYFLIGTLSSVGLATLAGLAVGLF